MLGNVFAPRIEVRTAALDRPVLRARQHGHATVLRTAEECCQFHLFLTHPCHLSTHHTPACKHRACPPPHYLTRIGSTTPRRCHRTHTVPTNYQPPHRTHRTDYRPPHPRSSLPSHRQRLRGRSDRCDRRANRSRQCGGRGSAADHRRAVPGALRVLRARTALQSILRCGRGGASGGGKRVPKPPCAC